MIFRTLIMLLTIAGDGYIAASSPLINPFVITSGNCEKNISVKYQVPVTRTRKSQSNTGNEINAYTEQYIDYEERIRWDTVQLCCPGYRTIIFGLCKPICEPKCLDNSFCAEPNKCICMHGYEPSHYPNKEHQLYCRPVCMGGCPLHSHCVAPNKCECRAGFKDISAWFSTTRCERIQCTAADQRYDIQKHGCIKIEMSVEELMQQVGEKLSHGAFDANENGEDDVLGEREIGINNKD